MVVVKARFVVSVLAVLALAIPINSAFAQSGAGELTYAQANRGVVAPWAALDLSVAPSAEGRRQSQVFSISGHAYRLYVRDIGVATARGLHDRVCVESASDPAAELPPLAISTTSAGPDGRRPLRNQRFILGRMEPAQQVVCELLPPAGAYRVWSLTASGGAVPTWSPWRAPAVFSTFEPMADQDDQSNAMRRNLEQMVRTQKLDGVCLELAVIRAPFSSPQGALDWPVWFDTFRTLEQNMRGVLGLRSRYQDSEDAGYVAARRGVVQATFAPWDEGGQDRYASVQDLPPTGGFAHLHTIGFMPRENIDIYMEERPLDPQYLPIQVAGFSCHGDPITYRPRGQPFDLEVYALARIAVVVPYWIEYGQGRPEAQAHWRAYNDRTLRHEAMHAYDMIDVVNEAVFRIKGQVDLMENLAAARVSPAEGRRYGLVLDYSQVGSMPSEYFRRHLETINSGNAAAAGYFHNAIYAPDRAGQQTRLMDIDLRSPMVFAHGDPDVLAREYARIIAKWVRPTGASN